MPARKYPFRGEELVSITRYDPETGYLWWTVGEHAGERADLRKNIGYPALYLGSQIIHAHRLCWRHMTGAWPEKMVDHIDGSQDNNRWVNLRAADHSVNAQNLHRALCTNRTGLLGVSIDKRRVANPFRAGIRLHGKHFALGHFPTPEQAHAAYLRAKAVLHPGCGITRDFPVEDSAAYIAAIMTRMSA